MKDNKMNEDERLYLQFLQNNIARMNSNSAQAKGWCIAIVAALLAIFTESKNDLFLIICVIPIILFCILDSLYLQQEHKFVQMYNAFITDNEDKPNLFEMPMKKYSKGIVGFLKALKSWSVVLVYLPLLMVILVMLSIGKHKDIIETVTVEDKIEIMDSPNFNNENIQNEIFITSTNDTEVKNDKESNNE